MSRIVLVMALCQLITFDSLSANPITELLKAGGRTAARKGGGAAARQTVKQAAKHSARKAANDSVRVASRSRITQAMRHFADDATRAGKQVAPDYVDDLAKVSTSVTAQNHRRLMMLAPELKQSGRAADVIKHVAKSNSADESIEFLWRHRGKLASAAAATAAVIHADDIAEAGGKYVTKPLIEKSVEHVAKPVATAVTMVVVIAAGLAAALAFFKPKRLRWSIRTILAALRNRRLRFAGNHRTANQSIRRTEAIQ